MHVGFVFHHKLSRERFIIILVCIGRCLLIKKKRKKEKERKAKKEKKKAKQRKKKPVSSNDEITKIAKNCVQ